MTTDPQRFEILLVPEHVKNRTGAPRPDHPLRSAVVEATGETGVSGYPRYTGEGMEADIDPATRTVEKLLIDGAELDPGLTALVAPEPGKGTPRRQ
ncbi:hypothetical protein [Streptomyces sp. ISL-94]|uniref:hypothetical protein n=1 Tax=Streptomyces sp. ISL-94 TaxID=2819190 RepID=UPI001BE59A38|nr:hypothetical protein [Streptomyces sp. ISL-94]MBT2478935.1 hypothetical protein [Streptomyces sp. ISL-94]